MSIECGECERDLRGPHAKSCSRYRPDADLGEAAETSATTMSEKHESENKPRIYVACSSREIERAERAMAAIRAAGGEVTFDWTVDVRRYGSQAPDVATGLRCAMADLEGVTTANVVLVLDGEYSYGRIVEHGAALALRKPVVVAGRPHGRIWETLEAARISGDNEAVVRTLSLARRIATDEQPTHQETLRQLAEVTAERDALRQQLATTDACRELNQEQRDEWRGNAEQAIAERDALKRRVEELEREEDEMSEKRFPIQGGLSISWPAAEEAYRGYSRLYGTGQSLERMAERGGFGLQEFVCNVAAARCATTQQAREATRYWPLDHFVVAVLVAADVRTGE